MGGPSTSEPVHVELSALPSERVSIFGGASTDAMSMMSHAPLQAEAPSRGIRIPRGYRGVALLIALLLAVVGVRVLTNYNFQEFLFNQRSYFSADSAPQAQPHHREEPRSRAMHSHTEHRHLHFGRNGLETHQARHIPVTRGDSESPPPLTASPPPPSPLTPSPPPPLTAAPPPSSPLTSSPPPRAASLPPPPSPLTLSPPPPAASLSPPPSPTVPSPSSPGTPPPTTSLISTQASLPNTGPNSSATSTLTTANTTSDAAPTLPTATPTPDAAPTPPTTTRPSDAAPTLPTTTRTPDAATTPPTTTPSSDAAPTEPTPKFPVDRRDLLIAIPTVTFRHEIVYASGATWRGNLTTFVSSNGTQAQAVELHNFTFARNESTGEVITYWFEGYNATGRLRNSEFDRAAMEELLEERSTHFPQETWGVYPDEIPSKGYTPGDLRMMATVRLAHEAFEGRYKWMLWGDDDCYYFIDNMLHLLQDLDPDMPYYISDDIGGCCHFFGFCPDGITGGCQLPGPEGHIMGTQQTATGSEACILQPAANVCNSSMYEHPQLCEVSKHRMKTKMWANGGRGLVISRGLLNSMQPSPSEALLQCEDGHSRGGGDTRLASCFHQLSGLAPINPTRDRRYCKFGRRKPSDLIKTFDRINRTQVCDQSCDTALHDTVTTTMAVHHDDKFMRAMGVMKDLFDSRMRAFDVYNAQG